MGTLVRRPIKRDDTSEKADEVAKTIDESSVEEDSRRVTISKDPEDCVSTTITLLNCALTDNPYAGFALGRVSMVVGDSSSGKSFILLSLLAGMCNEPRFDHYNLYYDDSETAFDYDAEKLFGKEFLKRVEFNSSNLAEDFYGSIMVALDSGKPFVYILDSYDSLTCSAELERAEIARKKKQGEKLTRKQEQSKGGYKTEKVKLFAEVYRRCRNEIGNTRSIFIPVFQTIDAINSQFVEKARRGGNAPKFFSSHEVWLKNMDIIKSKGLEIGGNTQARVAKNKLTGKHRTVSFPIFYDYGIDDTRANIEFLVEQEVFKTVKESVKAEQFGFEKITINKLIKHIETNDLRFELADLVGKAWLKREDSVKIDRVPRF